MTPENHTDACQALFINTDKKIIPTLPRILFEGRIVTVCGETEAKRAVEVLRQSPLIGIDTETRPSFQRGQSYKVALLQASTEELCFLFRLNLMGLPGCLTDLLADTRLLKVGLSLGDDFRALRRRADFNPAGYVDLQNYAAEMGVADMSLQKLYANVFGQRISKTAQLSNWEAQQLTEAQQRYAATDAYACIQLYKRLKTLRESGNYTLVSQTTATAS